MLDKKKATKKKSTIASKIRGHGAAMKKAAAARPGAYQTHPGGVILNVNDDLLSRGIGYVFDSTEKALSSKKAPQRGKQAYGNRKKKNSQKRK